MELHIREPLGRLIHKFAGCLTGTAILSLIMLCCAVPEFAYCGEKAVSSRGHTPSPTGVPNGVKADQPIVSGWPLVTDESPTTALATNIGKEGSVPPPAWPVTPDELKQKVSITPPIITATKGNESSMTVAVTTSDENRQIKQPFSKEKDTKPIWPTFGEQPLLVASNPPAPKPTKEFAQAPQQDKTKLQAFSALEPEDLPEEIPPEPPAANQTLDLSKVVQLLGEQNKLDPASLSVQEFETFAVISHKPSNRNWVIARSTTNEGWLLASTAPGEVPPPGADVCVVEVDHGQVANQPKLLSELDAPDQPLIAQGSGSGSTTIPKVMGVSAGAPAVPGTEPIVGPPVTMSGFLQFGTSYHTNILRADEGIDYDLVVHRDEEAEIADVVFQPAIGLRLDLNPRLAQNTYFEYIGYADFFNKETGENRWRHSLEFNTRGESGDLIDLWWRGGVIFHDQLSQDEAEYYAQDFMEFWINPGLDFFITDKDTFTLSTPVFYRDVSDDGLPNKSLGLGPDPGDPYNDPVQGGICAKSDIERYADHVGFGVDGTWRRRFSECLETRLRVGYLRRQYDRPALDEYGAIYGCEPGTQTKGIYDDRQDDELETSLGFTYAMNECTGLGVAYRFRINSSNGPFYDYDEHGMRVVANHTIFHGRWCEANLRLTGDVAWRKWDSRRADNMTVDPLPPHSGPDGLLTPGYDEDFRDDIYYCARLGFDREFGCYTVGTFYQFETNDSNDGSGSYKDHGVGAFVRMEY